MKKNPNYYAIIAMFIALFMVAALGPTKASVNTTGYPVEIFAFDTGPPHADINFLTATLCEVFIMIERGVAVPVIELINSESGIVANVNCSDIAYYKNYQNWLHALIGSNTFDTKINRSIFLYRAREKI